MAAQNSSGETSKAARRKGRQHIEGKTAAGFLAILTLLTLVGWLYLIQVSQVTEAGYRLQELYDEKERLRRDNALLRLQIAKLERLDILQARASELGFVAPSDIEYLAVANYPLPPSPETRSTAAAAQPSIGSEEAERTSSLARWWAQISAQFANWAGGP